MERTASGTVFSASDLVDFVNCAHLSVFGREIAAGKLAAPAPSEEERLVARKGDAHEAAYLARLQAEGVAVVEIARSIGAAALRCAAGATSEAMRAGAAAIHGATLLAGDGSGNEWLGIADFLVRVPGISRFGDYAYEVWDAKLARTAKPSAIVQMCVYTELLSHAQGSLPEHLHAILGDGRIQSFRTGEVMPYYRAAKARFLAHVAAAPPTYPDPVAHCSRCRWQDTCVARRRADDHLSLVANVRRSQIVKLDAAGIATMAALAAAPDEARPGRLERTVYERVRAQAALQVAARADGLPRYELLEPRDDSGFARLPEPDRGDLYFDMEGDPFYDGGGLEYLFGVAHMEGGERRFTSFCGHDRPGERLAFEGFVDFVMARRRVHPKLHVYHYAAYEATALRRLAGSHGTREDEIDVLLREKVLVDLYEIVRQALRASFESYSLKKIEQFYRGPRGDEVTSAIGSVVAYERFLETGERHEFDEIVNYNREDCYSTLDLHRWLLERKLEAQQVPPNGRPRSEPSVPREPSEEDRAREALAAELSAGSEPAEATPAERARWLAGQLLYYHKREAKPAWWAFFERLEQKTVEELLEDPEAIGNLTASGAPPEFSKRSQIVTLSFPPQEHKLSRDRVFDPLLGPNRSAGTIVDIDDDRGLLRLQRGPTLASEPLPRALCPPGPIGDDKLRSALVRFAKALARDGCRTRFRAARDLLYGDAPRLVDRVAGAAIDDGATTPEQLAQLTVALDESYLFVQGPPGAGKTWTGARAIVDLIARGLRVGIASTSHRAIHHLVGEVERVANERGVSFRGYKKRSADASETEYPSLHGRILNTEDVSLCASDRGAQLLAGTAWLFSDEKMSETLDVLVLDEAGQISLANAIAMATSARSVLLLGDPMQLAQVSQGQHPGGAAASVLAHLLGERTTVSEDRGLFLPRSYRMHPAICAYVSALAYEGRLRADESCARRRIEAGTASGSGLRYLPVPHEGNVQQSPEEAEAIAHAVGEMIGGTVVDERGRVRPLEERDVMVVTPYNANVRRVRQTLDAHGRAGVRVGTVDKFQGQEAPVVFFSLAASRGEELPRGIAFLFDRNRLNVAVSRAQALAVLVCAPALLETPAATVEQVVTIGALCRFVEEAEPLFGPRTAATEISLV